MSYSASEYDRDSVGLSSTHGLGCVVFGETWLAEEGILVPENWGFFSSGQEHCFNATVAHGRHPDCSLIIQSTQPC